ncbi:multiple sugar ABC transporter [Gracilibacillus boraciitolerans JCM 21714]|uniref:Multiple sugar ABC transporter n=1 Tax=Gracilibacillus boraciitolerans JCM 21714 TaxID=1298598 RepID=W4VKF2_9BACI|nr:sugar ABC transporter permease [Gracilibacillus boraciitolerans]GAE93249.1 multiple sugar ABC transporter [Gracilibacillus boraciitolerans JCM 21714]
MQSVLRDKKAIMIFILPALLIFLSAVLIPTVWSIGYSFFEGSPIRGFTFIGFENYVNIFSDRQFLSSFWLSIKYAGLVTTGQVFLGLILAIFYVLVLKRFSVIIRTLIFFPIVLPAVAVAQLFSKIFEITPQLGLVNSLLSSLNLDMWVQAWLGNGDTAFWVIVVMDIWRSMGFYAVLLYAGLIDIPEDVIEAARIDGANGLKLSRFVIIPMIKPILISAIIFSLNGTLKVFESVVALTNGGPGTSTSTLTLYMYHSAFAYNEYGYGSTVAVFLLILCLMVTLLIYRYSRQNID